MLKSSLGVLLNLEILHGKLLPSRPPHDGFRYFDALLIRKCDGEREGFPWSHGEIAGQSPPCTREIPDRALALKWTCVIRDGALHWKATVGTNREGHEGLAGWRILGGVRTEKLGPAVGTLCYGGRKSVKRWGRRQGKLLHRLLMKFFNVYPKIVERSMRLTAMPPQTVDPIIKFV
jgi:hypothetical protein